MRRRHAVLVAAAILSASPPSEGQVPSASATEATRRSLAPANEARMIWMVAGLVVARSIPDNTVATMRAEVDRIWNRVGVRIRWLLPGPPLDAAPDIIVVVADTVPYDPPGRKRTLGCIQRDRVAGAVPIIRIFPEGARLVVGRELVPLCARCGNGWRERLTATLLGRALAHEIGHHLLGAEHSAIGLMRAELQPRDLLRHEAEAVWLTDTRIQQLTSLSGDRSKR